MKTKLFVTSAAILALAIASFMFVPSTTRTGETPFPRIASDKSIDFSNFPGDIPVTADNQLCGTVMGVDEDGEDFVVGTFSLAGQDWRNSTEEEKAAAHKIAVNRAIDSHNARISKNNSELPPSDGLVSNAYAPPTCRECGEDDCCELWPFPGRRTAGGGGHCLRCQTPYDCILWEVCCQEGVGAVCGPCSVYGC